MVNMHVQYEGCIRSSLQDRPTPKFFVKVQNLSPGQRITVNPKSSATGREVKGMVNMHVQYESCIPSSLQDRPMPKFFHKSSKSKSWLEDNG